MNQKALESEMAQLLSRIPDKDIEPHHIGNSDVTKFANPVERFLNAYVNVQDTTARASLELAEWFEQQAAILRNHAATINHQAMQIPEDLRRAVEYEQQVRELVQRLSTVR